MNSRIAIAVALACASSISLAQQNKSAAGAAAGFYAGISGGRSSTSFTTQDYSVSAYNRLFPASAGLVAESTDKRGTAWRVFYGYNFDANWALEGAYTSLGDAKFNLRGLGGVYPTTAAESFKLDNSSFSLAVKGTLPVSAQFDIFALLGGTYNRSELTRTASGRFATDLPISTSANNTRGYGMGGLGVEFKPQKNWGIRAEYQSLGKFGEQLNNTTAKTGRSSVDTWLIGATFRF